MRLRPWNNSSARYSRLGSRAPSETSSVKSVGTTTSLVSEAESAAINAVVHVLNAFWNSKAPVNALPAEVLCKIFFICCLDESPSLVEFEVEDSTSPVLIKEFNPGWINVTYVCHHWREVGLGDPGLWAHDITGRLGPCWMVEMLDRSKTSPVSLSYDNNGRECGHEWLVSTHLPHTRHLKLKGPRDLLLTALHDERTLTGVGAEAEAMPVMILETVDLSFEDLSLEVAPELTEFFVLPEDTAISRAAHIHRLVLHNCFMPLTIKALPALRNLSYLDISASHGWLALKFFPGITSEFFPRYDQLFHVLQQMSSLKTLSLKCCLPPAPSGSLEYGYEVTLPNLEHLELEDASRECRVFMNHLNIPHSTKFHLSYIVLNENHKLACRLLAVILNQHCAGAPAPFQALTVHCPPSSEISLQITAWTFVPSATRVATREDSALFLTISRPGSLRPPVLEVVDVFCNLPLGSVSLLHCNLEPRLAWEESQLLAMLQCCPSVNTLQLTGAAAEGAIKALDTSAGAASLDPKGKGKMLVQRLRLVMIAFTVAKEDLKVLKGREIPPPVWAALMNAFETRQSLIGVAPELFVTRFRPSMGVGKMLERITEVHWENPGPMPFLPSHLPERYAGEGQEDI
ncbi:hypothetical protein EWM64_g1036 [Hericium alpestre]|uniref:Uncharacterized protein n=1 Tax=Hericium alpestre TaxID=135208 RepID=A0A4Z0AAH8_9AGAM|nr:hypothetical protein EWM64_g1036 [Hericium alpestre]